MSEIRAPNFHFFPTHLKDQISRSPRSFMANPFRLPLRQVAIEIVKYELAENLDSLEVQLFGSFMMLVPTNRMALSAVLDFCSLYRKKWKILCGSVALVHDFL